MDIMGPLLQVLVMPIIRTSQQWRILRIIMTLPRGPERLPGTPAVNNRTSIVLMFLEFIVRVTRRLSGFRRDQYRIVIELA